MAGSGITFLRAHDADIPTPAAGKVTVYFSIEQAGPAYKDDAGLVFPLEGPTGVQGPAGVPGYAEDGLEGESYPIVAVGPQGNQGLQGDPGPMGQTIIPTDFFPDELPFVPAVNPFVPDEAAIFVAKVNITDAEFRTMNTVPKTIPINAPGANKVIVPLKFQIMYELTSTFSATPTWNVRPVGGTSTHFVAISAVTNATLAKKATAPITAAIQNGVNLTTTNQINTQWEIFTSAAASGGSTTNGFNFYFWYSILSLP